MESHTTCKHSVMDRLCAVAIPATFANGASGTRVLKTIAMMKEMLEKGKKKKHEEQVQFVAYKQFCDDTTVENSVASRKRKKQLKS